MKSLWAILLVLVTLYGCARPDTLAKSDPTRKSLVTIKYTLEPMRTFQVGVTNQQGLTINELAIVLRKYKSEYPGAEYEVYAEVKCVPEESERIIRTLREAGIELKHYWAPVSYIDPSGKAGPYGPGHVDIVR